MTGFPHVSPDWQFENVKDNPYDEKGTRLWRKQDGFCEVKFKSSDGPPTNDSNTNSDILSQSANYARIHMSARPFLLFSIGLLIYGSRFCVCIFDRAGVRISPECNMWSDLEMFVRVIRSLTCILAPQDIGQDPTAELLERPGKPDCFIIKPIGKDSRRWCTIGSPIWSSLSLFGRGTVVWKVAEYNAKSKAITGPTMIMKTAWRSAQRNPESSLSRYVTAIARANPEVSVTEFVAGGDVFVEGGSPPDLRLATEPSNEQHSSVPTGTLITVPHLRFDTSREGETPILHRVITSTVGRPFWEYKDDKELARGFIAVLRCTYHFLAKRTINLLSYLLPSLSAHKKLCELNVLHRDISPGNMLLAEKPKSVARGHEGFLSDFELARVGDEVGVYVYERVGPDATRLHRRTKQWLSGSGSGLEAPITVSNEKILKKSFADFTSQGTLQFMAVDLLDVIISQAQMAPGTYNVFKQQPYHDLESIVWVFSYIQLRKMLSEAGLKKKEFGRERALLNGIFRRVFGKVNVVDIREQRRLLAALEWVDNEALNPFLHKHLSEKLGALIGILYRKMSKLSFQKRLGGRGKYLSKPNSDNIMKDPDQAKYDAGEEEELTHDYLIGLFRQVCDED